VKDAVRALILARDAENPTRRVFNISEEAHPINHIANIVRKHVPDASIEFDPNARVRGSSYDDSNARKELGWRPSYDIEEGIRDQIEEVRRRLAVPTDEERV
jgi:nucleoside-diphosphate-sugar epimerase